MNITEIYSFYFTQPQKPTRVQSLNEFVFKNN